MLERKEEEKTRQRT